MRISSLTAGYVLCLATEKILKAGNGQILRIKTSLQYLVFIWCRYDYRAGDYRIKSYVCDDFQALKDLMDWR